LYQTLRTGNGQYIDMAMMDVALMMQATHITDHLHSGHNPKRSGNQMRFAETSMFESKDGLIQLAASNPRQHRRFYKAIDEAAEAERTTLDERYGRYEEKLTLVAKKMKEKTADEWENYLEERHIPAMRVRELRETLADPQLKHRGLLHRHDNVPGVGKPVTVPVAAFKFKHDGPSLDRPPARMGEHTEAVLKSAGYSADEITALRKEGAIV
ncbi:MAG TPA: CoA transferase, partial [Burkholderiales bacterium]|nr:CoA transferase [Burkholderiales bacterium]